MAQTVKNKQILISSDFDINSHKLINVVNPTNNQDAATKYYVDSVAQGVSPHEPVRVVSTTQITLNGIQSVDNISLVNGNFILVAGQTNKAQNGIYVVNSGGTWTRRPDADGNPSNEVELGDFVFIETGATNASSGWVLGKTNATGSIIIPGVDTQEWYKMSAPGSYSASGVGIELIGNMFTISSEISTRSSNESLLLGAISTEVSNRTVADGLLSTAISTESSTRGTVDFSLSTSIFNEISDRISGDKSLSSSISTISGNTFEVDDVMDDGEVLGIVGGNLTGVTYSTILSSESSLRTSGDQSLSTILSTEISTRTSADASLSTLISTNTSTDTSTRQSLSSGISTEVSTRTSADASLSTSISSRTSADVSLSTLISSRTSADASLSTLISTNTSTDTSVHQSLSSSVLNEVTSRLSQDASLSNSIISNSSSLSTSLSLEESDRISGDNSLSTLISVMTGSTIEISTILSDGEVLIMSNGQITGVTYLTPSLSTTLSTEISDRISADSSLFTDITSLSSAISGGSATALFELTDVSLSSLMNDDMLIYDYISGRWINKPLSTIISNETSSISSLSSAISNETSIRISEDASLSIAIESISATPTILHTVSGITSNSSFGVLDSGLTLGMIYITNTGTVNANVNLGITPTGTEINEYGIVPITSGETLSITVNRRLSNTESKTMYISSSNWTDVILKIEWAEITYINQYSTGGYELLNTTLSSEISTRSNDDNLLFGAISTEVSNRSVADGLLSTAISNELSVRASADSSLSTSINNKGGVTWSVVTADGSLLVNKGVLANKGTLLTLTLPTSSSVGDVIRVAGMNSGLWKITQSANQYIRFGNASTTVGVTGYLASVATYDVVEMLCLEANLGWLVISSIGNLEIV